MKRKITSLTTAIIVLCVMLIGLPEIGWGQSKTPTTLAGWVFSSTDVPTAHTDFDATTGDCEESTINFVKASQIGWKNTKSCLKFTRESNEVEVLITLELDRAIAEGVGITFKLNSWYNGINNAPMKGFNLTVSENGGSYVTTGLSVTNWSLGSSSDTKSVVYTTQNELASGETIKLKLVGTNGAGNGEGYIQNVYVEYTPATYSVTYNSNGASNGSVPSDDKDYLYKETVTVKGNTGTLTKDGYTWSGWCLNSSGAGTVYGPTYTTTYSITDDVTFYAKWVENGTPNIEASDLNLEQSASSGSLNFTINNPAGGTTTANITGGNEGGWLTLGDIGESSIPLNFSVNNGSTRSATVTITYTYTSKTQISKDVTVTQAGLPPLSTPTLTVTAGNGKVTPSWTAIANATGYTLEYATNNSFTSATTVAGATSGTDITGLTNETTYYFRLKALGNNSTYSSSAWSSTVSAVPNNRTTITITQSELSSFTNTYNWYTWTAGGISGQVYAYKNNGIQVSNNKNSINGRFYNTDVIPGTIKSIRMTKTASGTTRPWTVKVDNCEISDYDDGTTMGEAQDVNGDGVTWDVSGNYSYFQLYVSDGATVIASVEIAYAPKSHHVTYNSNFETPETKVFYYDAAEIVTTAAANLYTHPSEYTFNSWNTEADGSGTSYAAGAEFDMPDGNVVLYAQWNHPALSLDVNNELTASTTINAGEVLTISSTTKIPEGVTLTVDGTLVNTIAANLIIEDGGQLIVNNAGVQATVKKSVATWTGSLAKGTNPGWQTISTSTRDAEAGSTIAFTNVENLIYLDGSTPRYNVYSYDEANIQWINNLGTPGFSILNVGQGYIYRTGGSSDLEYKGYVNTGDIDVILAYGCGTSSFKGFNLIGNPYTHTIYKGTAVSAIPNGSLLEEGYYALNLETGMFTVTDDGTAIPRGTAIMVQAKDQGGDYDPANYTLTMANSTSGASGSKAGNDNIWFSVKNENFQDFACVKFKPGRGLNKIDHQNENAPMLYINHNGENFGSVNMSDDTKSINLNFKAMTMGKYTLSLKPEGNFSYIHVIDKLTGEDIDMLLEGEYSFIASPSDADNRFIVKLGYQPDYGNDSDIFAYQSGSEIYVTGNGELQIFDVTGRRVMTTTINGSESISIPNQGVYIFRLNEKVQKIVVR